MLESFREFQSVFSCNWIFQSLLCAGSYDKLLCRIGREEKKKSHADSFLSSNRLDQVNSFPVLWTLYEPPIKILWKILFYLFIKKPISKYCIVATVCHILFFIFLEFTCIYCIYAIITNFSISKLDHGVAPLGCLPAGGDTISCFTWNTKK
jgi:hypothetical protein